ncbi:hypothetical protein D3C76_1705510 [compost metagenome]
MTMRAAMRRSGSAPAANTTSHWKKSDKTSMLPVKAFFIRSSSGVSPLDAAASFDASGW